MPLTKEVRQVEQMTEWKDDYLKSDDLIRGLGGESTAVVHKSALGC